MKFFNQIKRFFIAPNLWVWLLPVLLIVPNVALAFTEQNSPEARIANVLFPLGLYMLICSAWKRTGIIVLCMIPAMVLCAFQIVLLYLYGESIISIDMYMNVVTTNVGEATELLGNLRIALITVVILYVPAIAAGICLTSKKQFANAKNLRRSRIAGLSVAVPGAIMVIAALIWVPSYNPQREIFPYNVVDNLATAVCRTRQAMHYHHTAAQFSYEVSPTRARDMREVYVLVIGETARADNWSLFGYDRPTNPKLEKRQGLTAFGKTLSEINTTHKSVPMLMSYLTARDFGDSVAYTRSVFSAFNDCGYQTVFISNQRRNHSYIDDYGEEARTARFLTDNSAPGYDINLVQPMTEIIENSASNKIFVILHCYGSHFEYRKRYPANMAQFTPERNSEASRLNRKQLMNAYDNTILYTDMMLDSVISTLDRLDCPAAMMYVSDHGEDIFDDSRERFLHSSPTPTFHQLHVPLLVWMSSKLSEGNPEMVANLAANSNKFVSSTRSVFHTLLDIAGISTPYYDTTASLTSKQYKPAMPIYLNDYNEAVPLSRSGMRKPDFELLKKNGFPMD